MKLQNHWSPFVILLLLATVLACASCQMLKKEKAVEQDVAADTKVGVLKAPTTQVTEEREKTIGEVKKIGEHGEERDLQRSITETT